MLIIPMYRVFNFLFKEKLSDMGQSWWGLYSITAAKAVINDKNKLENYEATKLVITFVLSVIQGLVFAVTLCPLGVLYVLGLYISAGVSLWRLIEHDFGNKGGANMKPALQTLYSLAVAQGVLFGYKTIHDRGRRSMLLAKFVAGDVSIMDEELVTEYLDEIVTGCQKDPSFATGRNLVTYGVDLMMEAPSNDGFIAGISVLAGAIKHYNEPGRLVLAKHLLMTRSHSWSHMIRRLLETVGPRSPYSKEVREHAARIVALIARSIRLEQFPGAIECVSSLLDDTTAECSQQQGSELDIERRYYSDNYKGYHKFDLLEEYEKEYVCDSKSPGSPDSPLSSLMEWLWLVNFLPCKWKTVESEPKEIQGENTVNGFDRLLTEAVNIIHQLAFDEDNRVRIMSNTMLQYKIVMAPLKLHRDGHTACRASQESELQMLEKCWVLIKEWHVAAAKGANSQGQMLEEGQPAAAPSGGGGGGRRRSGEEIQEEVQEGEVQGHLLSGSSMVGSGSALDENNAITNNIKSTIKSIFDCLDCRVTQKRQGVEILLHLSLDLSFMMDSESSRRRLTWILLLIIRSPRFDHKYWMASGFTDGYTEKGVSSYKSLAGKRLSEMLLGEKHDETPSEESERDLQLIRLALGDLTSALADDAEDISVRTHAAIIMEGLCIGLTSTNLLYQHLQMGRSYEEEGEILVRAIPKVNQYNANLKFYLKPASIPAL